MVPLKWRLKFSSINSSACPRVKNSTTNQSFMEQTAYKKWKLWPESAFHFLRVKTSYAPHQGRRKVWKCGRVSSNVVVWIGLTHPLKSWGGGDSSLCSSSPVSFSPTHHCTYVLRVLAGMCSRLVTSFSPLGFESFHSTYNYIVHTYLHITALCMNQLVHRGWYNE